LHSIWHSIISVIIYEHTPDFRVAKNSWIAYLDRGALGVFVSLFIMIHVAMIIWLYRVPLKHRKQMKQKDYRYRILMLEKMNGNDNRSFPTTEEKTVYDRNYTSRDFTII